MKLVAGLLYVALVVSATGDESVVTPGVECTMEVEGGVKLSANETMYRSVEHCFSLTSYQHMGKDPSDELIRETMTGVCGTGPVLAKCLDNLDAEATVCLDAGELTRHRLYRHYRELYFEAGCQDFGWDVVERYREMERGEDHFLAGCETNATAEVGEMGAEGANSFVLHQYRVQRETRGCFETHRGGESDKMADWGIAVCSRVMDGMRCVDEHGADVLCKTIVDAGHEAR